LLEREVDLKGKTAAEEDEFSAAVLFYGGGLDCLLELANKG